MKKNFSYILIKTSVFIFLFFMFTNVYAQTWSAPTGSPPSNNVYGPLNVGSTNQFKLGALGIGEASSTTVGTSTGFTLEVNGPASFDGFSSFGASVLTENTHVGPLQTCSSCYSGSTISGYQGTLSTAAASTVFLNKNSNTNLAENSDGVFGFLNKIGQAFTGLLAPQSAYATLIGNPPIITVSPPISSGPCYGQWCNSEQYCDSVQQACESDSVSTSGSTTSPGAINASTNVASSFTVGTGSNGTTPGTGNGLPSYITVGGSSVTIGSASRIPTVVAELSLSSIPSSGTFTPTQFATTTGTKTLYWNISSASNCSITSANPDKNYNISITLNPAGFAVGSHSIDFSSASPGTYTYVLTCQPIIFYYLNPHAVSSSVSVTVGDQYVMQVNGNTSLEGYVVADGNIVTNGGFIEQGKRVCLEDGTDCPINPATNIINPTDQGGSLELGANNLINSTSQKPYIDFHYGSSSASSQSYNMRIQNDANNQLSFYNSSGTKEMYLDSSGDLHNDGIAVYLLSCSSSFGPFLTTWNDDSSHHVTCASGSLIDTNDANASVDSTHPPVPVGYLNLGL